MIKFFIEHAEIKANDDFERGMAAMSYVADLTTDLLTVIFMFLPNVRDQMIEDCEGLSSAESWGCENWIWAILLALAIHIFLLFIPQLRGLVKNCIDMQKLNRGEVIVTDRAVGGKKFIEFYNFQYNKNSTRNMSTAIAVVNILFSIVYAVTAIAFSSSAIWLYFFIPILLTTWTDFELALRGSWFSRFEICKLKRDVFSCCKTDEKPARKESIAMQDIKTVNTIPKIEIGHQVEEEKLV